MTNDLKKMIETLYQIVSVQDEMEEEKKQDMDFSFDTKENIVKSILSTVNSNKLGEYVMIGSEIDSDLAAYAEAISRRKFRKKDILLLSILGDGDDDTCDDGMAITENAIYSWVNGNSAYEAKFKNIEKVDFDSDSLILRMKDGIVNIFKCEDDDYDDGYAMAMYNLVSDILEALEE